MSGEYNRLSYPNGVLIGNHGLSAGLSYGHALSQRFGVVGSVRGQAVSFDSGSRARSVSTTAGIAYQLGSRTRLVAQAGVLLAEQDEATVLAARSSGPGFAFRGSLSHRAKHTNFSLRAARDMGFTNGLGTATIRDRLNASASYGRGRWSLIGSVGLSHNESLAAAAPEVTRRVVNTWSGCVGAGLRVARNFSAVGSFLFAHQVGDGTGDLLDIDSYRGAIGVMFQTAPKGDGWKRQTGSSSIAASANATC